MELTRTYIEPGAGYLPKQSLPCRSKTEPNWNRNLATYHFAAIFSPLSEPQFYGSWNLLERELNSPGADYLPKQFLSLPKQALSLPKQ
jgi:hypothetical protein